MCIIILVYTWCRLEKVKLKEVRSHAKIVGTLVTVGGAMMMTLIKGRALGLPWTHKSNQDSHRTTDVEDPVKGALMITTSCLCYSSFYILQVLIYMHVHNTPPFVEFSLHICSTIDINTQLFDCVWFCTNASLTVVSS